MVSAFWVGGNFYLAGQVLPVDAKLSDQASLVYPDLTPEFDLTYLPSFDDYYTPSFPADYQIPHKLPENVSYPGASWEKLTHLLDHKSALRAELDRFLVGDKESLEGLSQMASLNSDTGKVAWLWLCLKRIEQNKANANNCPAVLANLKRDKSYLIASQAYFLSSLSDYRAKKYLLVIANYQSWQSQNNFLITPFSIKYFAFLSLLAIKNHQQAFDVGSQLLRQYHHSRWYPDVLEAFADLSFAVKNYDVAIQMYEGILKDFQPELVGSQVTRKLLWSYYFTDQSANLALALGKYRHKFAKDSDDVNYFDFYLALKNKLYQKLLPHYSLLAKDSPLRVLSGVKLSQDQYFLQNSKDLVLLDKLSLPATEKPKLYINFGKGIYYFLREDYPVAQKIFKIQLTKTEDEAILEKVRYNLGQTLLANHRYQDAVIALKASFYSNTPEKLAEYNYLAWYGSKDFKSILEAKDRGFYQQNSLLSDIALGYAHASEGNKALALDIVTDKFKKSDDKNSLLFGLGLAEGLSEHKYGLSLLSLAKEKGISLPLLQTHRIKFLLGLKQYPLAQELLDQLESKNDQQFILQIRLWLIQGEHEKVINSFANWVKLDTSKANSARYNFLLAEAYFKMEAYVLAESHYKIAQDEANNKRLSSLAVYNKLISVYYQKKIAKFHQMSQASLKLDLNRDLQILIMQNLADSYLLNGDYRKAELLYVSYIKFYDYKLAFITGNILKNAFKFGDWQGCLQYATKFDSRLVSEEHKIDNWLIASRCALKVNNINWITEVRKKIPAHKHRNYEQLVMLSLANMANGKIRQAASLLRKSKKQDDVLANDIIYDFAYAKLNFKQGKSPNMEKLLENLADYQQAGLYPEVMKLQALVLAKDKEYELATDILIKAIYSEQGSQLAGDYLLLAELMLFSNRSEDALSVIEKIDNQQLSSAEQKRLVILSKKINQN
ncbi:MAG: hypothetical protein JJV97_06585 [SAR324 cluster bacterium]|nr:hypothetical protein [SAR324 cluster bacterium]